MALLHMTDAGHQDIQDVYFRGATAPTSFAIRLVNDTVLGTDNWADVSANEKATQGGYTVGGATVNRDNTAAGWPTLALDSSEMQCTSMKVSWTASADWVTPYSAVCLVAVKAVNQLLGYANVTARTPLNGDTVSWTAKVKFTKV